MAYTSNHNGNLTIYVDRTSVTKSLSISESNTLSDPHGKIYGPSLEGAWDTNEVYIPSDVYSCPCDAAMQKNSLFLYVQNYLGSYNPYNIYTLPKIPLVRILRDHVTIPVYTDLIGNNLP